MTDSSSDALWSQTVDTLSAVLPQLMALRGKTLVVKYGGNAMTDVSLQRAFAQDIALLQALGITPVVVHGGGPQIEKALAAVGKEGRFVHGMRYTDDQTMQVVQWVLAGQVQGEIVGLINAAGGRAMGLTGRDGGLFSATRLNLPDPIQPGVFHDVGWVGDIQKVDPAVIRDLQARGYVPVISPIAVGENNQSFNVNADVVAGEIARALDAERLLLLTNTAGVLDAQGALLKDLTPAMVDAMVKDGSISGGMLPKIASALDSARSGVRSVHIMDGRVPHALFREAASPQGTGTVVRPDAA
ncbi:acetylglutamate kinase [Amphibiibacter pelophylacis]|uniref:Acetylglutamate kinase n=1 Tax=Amphibiibacter pelophylacis TaxID=1799477 RepID=A0ACC6P130_9BURK